MTGVRPTVGRAPRLCLIDTRGPQHAHRAGLILIYGEGTGRGEGHRGTNKRGGMGGGVRSQDGVTGKKEWGSQSQPIRCKRVGNKVGRYTDGQTEERKIDRLMCRQKEGRM